jgi:oligopeptide transport system substrate-binding protein
MVLEDLHWASESTLQLVHYLARHLIGHQILMIGTFRSEAVGMEHPLLGLRRRLTKEGLAQSLRLSRLPSEAVEELVLEMSGAGEAILPLAGRLAEETEGNPFFLMEIVKALFEMGTVRVERDSWQGDFARISEDELPLPVAMSEAIQARVRRLDEDSQEALRVAAVVGREFDFELLKAVWGRDEEEVLETLDDLLRHRVIEEGSGAMGRDYAFTHHKIQEVVYSALPRRHRQRAHALVGGAMESIYGPEPEELAGELAYHFLEAQRHDKTLTEKAISYLLQAGDGARTFYAHEEAIDHYEQALALLREQGEYERAARTLMKLGLTQHNAFDFKAARRAYQEGFVLWQRAGATEVAVPPAAAPHSLRVIWTEPVTLDPAIAFLSRDVEVIRQLYSGLVQTSPQMEVLPDVGRSWEVSEGGRRYVFHLRDDIRWSDETPVTAGDFEYAWKRLLDPATSSPSASLLYDVKGAKAFHQGEASDEDQVGVRALDEVTLAVELQGPTSYFLHVLACVPTYPMPRHAVEAHGEAWTKAGNIVTSGPFRLEAWNQGESMVLVRNPEYHGRFTGNLERVEIPLLADRSTPLEAYKADSLDVLYVRYLSEAEAARALQQYAGEWVSVPRLWTSALGFDVSRPPFDDVRVRRAFVFATDREALCQGRRPAHSSPAMGGFVPPGMPGHSPGIGLPYDPERARQLLAEAGYPHGGGFPPIAAVQPFLTCYEPILEQLQGQWLANLGVDVTFERVESEVYWDRLASARPQVFPSAWAADYADPDDFLRGATFRQETRWQHEVYDRLVEEARRAMDQRERMELYAQADRILVEEAPILLLFHEGEDLLVKPWVRRYPTSPECLWFWKEVILEPH